MGQIKRFSETFGQTFLRGVYVDSARYVKFTDWKIGLVCRFIQFVIVVYWFGFVFIYQHGYQAHERVTSTAITKVKGVILPNFSDVELNVDHPELYRRIWDPADYVFPGHGGDTGGFFLMTNVVITPNQKRGVCPEDPQRLKSSNCMSDRNCTAGFSYETGHGVQTGRCVPNAWDGVNKTCEISGWCPVSKDKLPLNETKALLEEAYKFKISVKNAVSFPKFGPEYFQHNIPAWASDDFLKTCVYNKTDPVNKFCPVFLIKDIVGSEFKNVSIKGGVYLIRVKWDCNLDFGLLSTCFPYYKFRRMDRDVQPNKTSRGLNFRYAEHHGENHRTLYKIYGIKFLVEVTGWGRKFSPIPFFLNIGAALGMLSLAQGYAYLSAKYLQGRNNDYDDVMEKKFCRFEKSSDGGFVQVKQKRKSAKNPPDQPEIPVEMGLVNEKKILELG